MPNVSECQVLIETGAIAKADADISGLGVIIAFVLSAYITFACVLIAYVFGLVDDGLLRPVDRLVLRAPSRASKHPQIHVALRKAILALSDQQIVTGIAILGAGFQGLRTGNINVYHFQIVIYLAWMSSSVHLSALTVLRPYLHFHRGVMVWRLVGMLTLMIMLIVALVPTVSNDWAVVSTIPNLVDPVTDSAPLSDFGIPAICFWGELWGDGVNPDSILSFGVLFVSYVWKMGGMFMPFRRKFEYCIRNPIDHLLEGMLAAVARGYERWGGKRWLWTFRVCLAIYLPLTAVLEALSSFSAALWLSLLGLVYGTMQILIPRSLMDSINPMLAEEEGQMNFGQLVPLILLVQPLGAVSEHFWLGHQDDEIVYEDSRGDDPYGAFLGEWQDGRKIVNLPEKPLLQYMAQYKLPAWTQQGPQRIRLRAFLYTSKLFHFLVWGVHAATAGTAGVVFWTDYQYIGYVSTSNWYYIVFGIAAWACVAPSAVLILAPWSRLGWYRWRKRRSLILGERKKRSLAHDLHLEPVQDGGPTGKEEGDSTTSPATAELGKMEPPPLSPTQVPLPKTPEMDRVEEEVWTREWRRHSQYSPHLNPVKEQNLRRLSTRSAGQS